MAGWAAVHYPEVTSDGDAPGTLVKKGVVDTLDALAMGMAYADVVSGVRERALDDLAAWESEDDETARSWLERNYGARGTAYLGAPSIESLFFGDASKMSAALLKWLISNADRSRRWFTNVATNGALCSRLADALRASGATIAFDSPVARVEERAGGVRVQLQSGDAIEADAAIVTTPGPITKSIVPSLSAAQAAVAAQEYASTVVVNVVVNQPEPTCGRTVASSA